jgi:hypothetical protein
MPFHVIRTRRTFDGRMEGKLVAQPSTARPLVIPDPRLPVPDHEPYIDAFHVRNASRAAALTPPREPAATAFQPPPHDLTADHRTASAAADLAATLENLRHMPSQPTDPDAAERWTAHRALLVQTIRNARRTLDGFKIGQREDGPSPAQLARAARLAAAEAHAKTLPARSPINPAPPWMRHHPGR